MNPLSKAAALVVSCVLAFPPAAEPQQRNVDVRFGILDPGDGSFIETTLVPNVAGQSFGWIATITPSPEPIRWSEELILPRAPREWAGIDGDPNVAVSNDRTIAMSRGTLAPNESEFRHFWGVTPGDPAGIYTVIVRLSDGVVAQLDFEVAAPRR